MKYITTKKSVLSKVAVIALMLMTTAYTFTNDHCEAQLDAIINTFIPSEKTLAECFNSSIKTPLNTIVEKLDAILRDFRREIENGSRGHGDELSVTTNELVDYVAQHFNVLLNIFKKYNGKPVTYAPDFSIEIKRDFNTEKIFGDIISKLKALRIKATHHDHKRLIKKIDALSQLIQKKKAEWSAKPDWVLFAGLTTRMNCR